MDGRFSCKGGPDRPPGRRPPRRRVPPASVPPGRLRAPPPGDAAQRAAGRWPRGRRVRPAERSRLAQSTSVLEAEQALLSDDVGVEVKPQASVTLAEAQARLKDVSASRAARAHEAGSRGCGGGRGRTAQDGAAHQGRPPARAPSVRRWGRFHEGIDLAAPMRTPEYAAADGVVLRARAASGYGKAVYILHENGDVTVYGHMVKILVEPGQYVDAGETIALLGNEGHSTGPHLHFEVRYRRRGRQEGRPDRMAAPTGASSSDGPAWSDRGVSRAVEESNRRLLRARDAMDRAYAEPLDIPLWRASPTAPRRTSSARSGPPSARPRTGTCSGGGSSGRCSCCGRPTAA